MNCMNAFLVVLADSLFTGFHDLWICCGCGFKKEVKLSGLVYLYRTEYWDLDVWVISNKPMRVSGVEEWIISQKSWGLPDTPARQLFCWSLTTGAGLFAGLKFFSSRRLGAVSRACLQMMFSVTTVLVGKVLNGAIIEIEEYWRMSFVIENLQRELSTFCINYSDMYEYISFQTHTGACSNFMQCSFAGLLRRPAGQRADRFTSRGGGDPCQ